MVHNNNNQGGHLFSGFSLSVVLLTIFFTYTLHTYAQDSTGFYLKSNTHRCVALRQGQTCYKKIQLQWQALQSGNYCLLNRENNTTLQCWHQESGGEIATEFESGVDVSYVLRNENGDEDLAEVVIKVSWVYEPKPDKANGWRLF